VKDVEIRSAKIIHGKGGSGSSTFRATLPTNWIQKMGLGQEKRDIRLEFDGETITIRRDEDEE
jgi:hypothetical protein